MGVCEHFEEARDPPLGISFMESPVMRNNAEIGP